MLARWMIIDEQFIKRVLNEDFPKSGDQELISNTSATKKQILSWFDSQLKSRHLDIIARIKKDKNLVYYTIGSSGHEVNAVLADVFKISDIAFLHYRSGAFFIQRAKLDGTTDPVYDICLSLAASRTDPICSGRHKVFGSKQLNIPPQTSTIASHLPKAVGMAMSISRAKRLKIDGSIPNSSVVLCSFGDASFNHSTSQGALNTAQWLSFNGYPLPLVFICEDNGIGISVETPDNWISTAVKNRPGIHYLTADGHNVLSTFQAAQKAEQIARNKQQPVFLHVKLRRLMGHAGSDIETHYWSNAKIQANEAEDPLLHTARILVENDIFTPAEIISAYERVREEVKAKMEQALLQEKLADKNDVMAAIVPNKEISSPPVLSEKERETGLGPFYNLALKKRHMGQLINMALADVLLQYPNSLVMGEDVGKKGGVYRVTADLQKIFGKSRVFDTILDEQSILGTAIGMAMNNFLPIPEIQFLAYVHNAIDQIRGEAATISFFSNGQYTNPMVIRVPGLAYQKGFGGHFHNDNAIAFFREIPGIIIACPSDGAQAVKLLRQCIKLAYEEHRVVVFLEPIALYMEKDLIEKQDGMWLREYPAIDQTINLGEVSVWGANNRDCVIVTYGNGYFLSRKAAYYLNQENINVKIIDLNWLSPLPLKSIISEIQGFDRLLIVDETRKTGSLSEELITVLHENSTVLPTIQRITAEDCFIPLGTTWQYVLPSVDDIITSVKALCETKADINRSTQRG